MTLKAEEQNIANKPAKDETTQERMIIGDNNLEKMNADKQAIYYNLLFTRMGLEYEVDALYLLGEGQEETFALVEQFIMFHMLTITKTGGMPQIKTSLMFDEDEGIYEFYLNGKVFDPCRMHTLEIILPEDITTKESYDEKSHFIMGKYYDKEMNFDEVFHQLMLETVPAWKEYREE